MELNNLYRFGLQPMLIENQSFRDWAHTGRVMLLVDAEDFERIKQLQPIAASYANSMTESFAMLFGSEGLKLNLPPLLHRYLLNNQAKVHLAVCPALMRHELVLKTEPLELPFYPPEFFINEILRSHVQKEAVRKLLL